MNIESVRTDIKALVQVENMSITSIAEGSKVAYSTLFRFINDKSEINPKQLKKLSLWLKSYDNPGHPHECTMPVEMFTSAWCKTTEPTVSTRYNP